MGSETEDRNVRIIASYPCPASETSDDELLNTRRTVGKSFAWLPPVLEEPGSGLIDFRGE